MNMKDGKTEVVKPTSQSGKKNQFAYERADGLTIRVTKLDWDGYVSLSENGSRFLFETDGYAFLDSLDGNNMRHYWIGVSYRNKERADTFFEMELEPFYDLITLYLNENNEKQFYNELSVIEFASQLLDRINQQV